MAAYVTDTHPLIWYASGLHARLPRRVIRIFEDASRGRVLVYVPALALLEISILMRSGRIRLREPFELWVGALFALAGFDLAPLDLSVIVESNALGFTRDPFDTSIVATARVKDIPLITKDAEIADSHLVEIAW
jgi:PIN domain nuclease of toxin-antitoxin system